MKKQTGVTVDAQALGAYPELLQPPKVARVRAALAQKHLNRDFVEAQTEAGVKPVIANPHRTESF